jgi:hypothetical protein
MRDGYKPVLDASHGGYWPGFDRDKELVFDREEWAGPECFKLADQGPYFNVAGLYWRDPKFATP